MVKKIVVISLLLPVFLIAEKSGIHGSIQIQTAKTIPEGKGNVDQLYGRANLMWSYKEDSTFSSVVHVRAYPTGFGYEPLLGASYQENLPELAVPAIASLQPPSENLPTWQIYEAWIRYKFPDFDIRCGRLITHGSKSLHFGNYLDMPSGGTFTLAREGVHNAVEFFKNFGIFNSKVHLGVGDTRGNRGYLRVHEKIAVSEKFFLGLGYKINVFDLIHHDINTDEARLTNLLDLSLDTRLHKNVNLYAEASWSHLKGDDGDDPLPVMLSLEVNSGAILKNFGIYDLVELIRIEGEYLYDRVNHRGIYQGVDQDFLWNLYGEKTWLKRMYFQGGIFAAPTRQEAMNIGIGVRFSSLIN